MTQREQESRSYLALTLLILSGEAIFLLPFVLPRIFRPTVLDVFQMDNVQLGKCYSAYGVVALASYLFGGPIADRFQPRKLMAIALWATALGGVVISVYPSHAVIQATYAYWGFTSIFLFWAAMLKATRQWGGETQQGRAFGFLDGGRGLVSAGIGTAGVFLFAALIGDVGENTSLADQQSAFRYVIYFTSTLVAVTGALVWQLLALPHMDNSDADNHKKISRDDILTALRLPSVWLLMVIVLCGYVGYKATDDLSLYAKEVMQMNEVNAAKIGTLLLYVRPFVGIAAGFLADWTRSITWITTGFIMMMAGAIMIGTGVIEPNRFVIFAIALLTTCVGVYSIRSLYFASMQEGNIPLHVTGTAIGLISVVGYTPDIFMGPLMGHLLESAPGERGHQNLFWMLAGFAAVGCVASLRFCWRTKV